VLIAFGIGAVYMGVDGRDRVRSDLAREMIVGTEDSTIAGQKVDTGAEAQTFAAVIRKHTLEATGGQTYAQMGRLIGKDGKPTSDESAAAINKETGKPVEILTCASALSDQACPKRTSGRTRCSGSGTRRAQRPVDRLPHARSGRVVGRHDLHQHRAVAPRCTGMTCASAGSAPATAVTAAASRAGATICGGPVAAGPKASCTCSWPRRAPCSADRDEHPPAHRAPVAARPVRPRPRSAASDARPNAPKPG
jgi:hypothetical protein